MDHTSLTKVAGTNPIIFIGTKLDLLPGDWRIHRLKLWLQKYAKKFWCVLILSYLLEGVAESVLVA